MKYVDEAGELLKDGLKAGEHLNNTIGNANKKENLTKYIDNIQLKPEPDKAIFWSGTTNGIGGKKFAKEYAYKNGGNTLEGLIESNGIKMPTWDISNPTAIKAWEKMSQVYATQVSGEVWAIIGTSGRFDSIWEKVELPTLLKNPRVTKITLIDPETLTETIIFRR